MNAFASSFLTALATAYVVCPHDKPTTRDDLRRLYFTNAADEGIHGVNADDLLARVRERVKEHVTA
jgi:hypothetical protein